MLRENCKEQMRVVFGTGRGQKTLGVVEKMNAKKAKVRTLEVRGMAHQRGPGQIWNVPYSLMEPANDAGQAVPDQVQQQLLAIVKGVERDQGCALQSALRDVLTDLRHIAADLGLDFDQAVTGSEEVYAEELADE